MGLAALALVAVASCGGATPLGAAPDVEETPDGMEALPDTAPDEETPDDAKARADVAPVDAAVPVDAETDAEAALDAEEPLDAQEASADAAPDNAETPDDAEASGCPGGCSEDETCTMGRCVPRCSAGWRTCGGDRECAIDLLNDDRHCGACGRACGAETRCIRGACIMPGVHLLAPISAHRVISARPWLRWEMPPGADMARVEVCDAPTCARVTHRWEVSGSSVRPAVALPVGVHFWRVSARRGGAFGAATARPWEFEVRGAVPPEEGGERPPLFDLDGDGVVDRVDIYVPMSSTPPHRRVAVYRSSARSERPDLTQVGDAWVRDLEGRPDGGVARTWSAFALGDMNGDGYGDMGFVDSYPVARWGDPNWWTYLWVYFGSPAGEPLAQLIVSFGALSPTAFGFRVSPVGDRNGDGFGDLAGYLSGGLSVDAFTVFGGRRREFELERYPSSGIYFVRGDFNADGREDLAVSFNGASSFPWTFIERRGMATRPFTSESPITPCDAVARLERWHWDGVRVIDHDDDGYDDLLVSDPERGSGVVLRGSPAGLSRPECIAVIRGP
jgi:hypothetical protein